MRAVGDCVKADVVERMAVHAVRNRGEVFIILVWFALLFRCFDVVYSTWDLFFEVCCS